MESLINNIDKLIKGTKEGKIIWEAINKNYIWKTKKDNGEKMNLVLQPTIVNDTIIKIMFRLWDVENQTTLIDVYTDSSSEAMKNKIFDLYNTAKDNENLGRVDILSDLLKDI